LVSAVPTYQAIITISYTKIGYRREGKKPIDIDGRSYTMEKKEGTDKRMWG